MCSDDSILYSFVWLCCFPFALSAACLISSHPLVAIFCFLLHSRHLHCLHLLLIPFYSFLLLFILSLLLFPLPSYHCVSSSPSSSAKVTLPSFLLPSLLWLLMCFLSLCACRPSAVHTALLLQLSVSPSAFDSQASDELSSNQSMSFSPSNSAQPIPCFDSGPSPAHSSPGAARQVSLKG